MVPTFGLSDRREAGVSFDIQWQKVEGGGGFELRMESWIRC